MAEGIKPEDLSCSDLKTHESYPHPIKISSYGSATVSRWRRPGAGEGEGGGGRAPGMVKGARAHGEIRS